MVAAWSDLLSWAATLSTPQAIIAGAVIIAVTLALFGK